MLNSRGYDPTGRGGPGGRPVPEDLGSHWVAECVKLHNLVAGCERIIVLWDRWWLGSCVALAEGVFFGRRIQLDQPLMEEFKVVEFVKVKCRSSFYLERGNVSL